MDPQELNHKIQKLHLPTSKVTLKLTLEGLFAFPEDWKTTDEANPNMFTYTARIGTTEFTLGKVVPRKLTEKQLRDQDEAGKKKAPGGKKDPKELAAEQERLKKLKQLQAQQQKKKQDEFEKLSEEDKKYFASEDPHKVPSIRFEKKEVTVELSDAALVVFEERVFSDKGDWIYFYKYPTINEEEIAKLKKSKPKTLNLNDLNPISTRAWVDYSQLLVPGATQLRLRTHITQVDETPETPKPNLEKAYILMKINVSQSLVKEESKDTHQLHVTDMIKDPPTPPEVTPDIQSVDELKSEIKLALESIAMEFSSMFWKDFNFMEEQKSINSLALPKRNDVAKRKEQFLYDFNLTGKYKILKERLKKNIVSICKHKFSNISSQYQSFTGVSTEAKDQFYSEIYNFLISTSQETLESLITEKKEELGVVTVPAPSSRKREMDEYIKTRIEESLFEKIERLSVQLQSVRDIENAKSVIMKALEEDPRDIDLRLLFIKFSLRNKIGSPFPQKIIGMVYECLRLNKASKELRQLYCLLLMSTKKKFQCKQAWVILKELIQQDTENPTLLVLSSFLFGSLLSEEALGNKFEKLAQRNELRKAGALPAKASHRLSPLHSEIPSIKSVCDYSSVALDAHRRDQLYLQILSLFSKYNLLGLAELVVNKISNKQLLEVQMAGIKVEIFKGNPRGALQKAAELSQTVKSFELIELLCQLTFQLKEYTQCEEYLKKSLRFKEAAANQSVYLRLASVYYQAGQYMNAKACLVKLLNLNKNHCLGWLKLGAVELRLKNYAESENCLREANILNPDNAEVWLILFECYASMRKLSVANQCLVNYLRLMCSYNSSGSGPSSSQIQLPARKSKHQILANSLQSVKKVLSHIERKDNDCENELIDLMQSHLEKVMMEDTS